MPENNVICPFCREDIPPVSHYCISCGKDLTGRKMNKADSFADPDVTVKSCGSCGAFIPVYARYCSACGKSQRYEKPDPLIMKQRMLEVIYIRMWGMESEPDKLFPSDWPKCCSHKQVFALAEAIAKNILIRETVAWNQV